MVLPAILKASALKYPFRNVSHNLLIYERVLILEAGGYVADFGRIDLP